MADFVQNSQAKTAVRTLASPIADVTAFNLIVQSVITDNPFGCVAYMTAGENHGPAEKSREAYTARIELRTWGFVDPYSPIKMEPSSQKII